MKIPQSIKIEKIVLGGMIINNKAHLDVLPILKLPEMFSVESHQHIFSAIQELSYENRPIDLMTVNEKLIEKAKLEDVGGTTALVDLSAAVSSAAHIEEHSRILVQYWLRRKMIEKSNKIRAMAFDDEMDSLEVLEKDAKLNDELNEILFSNTRQMTYADALEAVEKRVEQISSQKEGEFTGVPTGFPKVDQFTGGWQPSDLVIVAARPGMGKTALMLANLVELGRQGVPAGFFSLEMSTQQLAARTVAIDSNFHLTQLIRDGFEKNKYFLTLKERTDEMKKYPIFIDDSPNQDIRDIISKARIWKRKHDIQILIVDYIQLATDKTKGNNREQEIASISRNLKMLAKELNIPVIALSQLSRSVETRMDKRPKLSDLRESGAIEQDADIVTFLYRPDYYSEELPDHLIQQNANAEFSFGKYRSGSLSTLGLKFIGDKAKYIDPEVWSNRSSDEMPWQSPEGAVKPNDDMDIAF